MDEPTIEQIAKHYSAAMDSVNLINELIALQTPSAEELATIARNVEHLQIMVAKAYWTTEDLTPFDDAITAGSA